MFPYRPLDPQPPDPHEGSSLLNRYKNCDIKKRIPILDWLPKYQIGFLFSDFVAGISVALTAIPQGIAYAVVAGLHPQFGLYSGFIGCFTYIIFGSCKDVTIGPTAIMAIMVQKYVTASPDFAVLASFLSGIVILLLSLLNLGFLIQFISYPVTVGFTTAAAITIASGQIKSFFGLTVKSSGDFIDSWRVLFSHIGEIRLWDTLLGVATLLFLLILKKISDVSGRSAIYCKYVSLSRNAIAVLVGMILAYCFTTIDSSPLILTGKVEPGLPPFQFPPFSTTIGNQTVYFKDMLEDLGSSIIAIPLISILESIAIAKAFSNGKIVDATQEMFALGLCNIFGSFVSSMPTTGSFTRTAINNASGAQTTLGGIFTGTLVILSLAFLTETFYFIPKTTLAAVILAAMIFMIDIKAGIELWKTKKIDLIPFLVTILGCLFLGLEYGILCGVGINIISILYTTSRPDTVVSLLKISNNGVLLITPHQNLLYSSAEYFRSKILESSFLYKASTNFIIINGDFVSSIDSTVAKNLISVVNELRADGKEIIFWNWPKEIVELAWRFNKEFGSLFITTETLEDLVNLLIAQNILK